MNDVDERKKRNIKIAIIVLIFAAVAIAIYSAIILISRIGKYEVKVVYAPYASTVRIDGDKYKNNATHYLTPGKHTFKVEFENFDSLEQEYDITENTTVYGYLTPNNEAGEKYAREHENEFSAVSGLVAKAQSNYGKSVREQFPLMSKFPIKTPNYTLSYELSETDEFKVIVKANRDFRELAISRLMEVLTQDDITKYDVEIKEFESPFIVEFASNAQTDPYEYLHSGFGSAMDGFHLGDTKEEGNYLYGYIAKRVGYISDIYRFILKRGDAGWVLCGKPYPVLTSINTSCGVSGDILYKVDTDQFQ